MTGNSHTSIFVYFGDYLDVSSFGISDTVPVSDVVKFGGPGGFLGKIYDIRIYSPGTNRIGGIYDFPVILLRML